MRCIPWNLPRSTRLRPMMHKALGRYIQALLQPLVAPQVQLLIKKCRFQLTVKLLQKLSPFSEEAGAVQVTMAHELALMQPLDTGQRITDLLQTLIQHVLAYAHGLAGIAEQPGDLGL